mmetsp:Transcript_2852/g.10964  ORF Transcript_2852/g.10964 Transcript_2852/m.10964 type:complete len:280 (-) Transcript_2852:31-870(-)
MCKIPLGSGGNLVTTFPSSAPGRSTSNEPDVFAPTTLPVSDTVVAFLLRIGFPAFAAATTACVSASAFIVANHLARFPHFPFFSTTAHCRFVVNSAQSAKSASVTSCPTRYVRVARYSFTPSHCFSNPPPGAKLRHLVSHSNTSSRAADPAPINPVPSHASSNASSASIAPETSTFPSFVVVRASAGAVLTCSPHVVFTPIFAHAARNASGAPNGRNATSTSEFAAICVARFVRVAIVKVSTRSAASAAASIARAVVASVASVASAFFPSPSVSSRDAR